MFFSLCGRGGTIWCFCSLCVEVVRYGVFVRCVGEVGRNFGFVRCVVEVVRYGVFVRRVLAVV